MRLRLALLLLAAVLAVAAGRSVAADDLDPAGLNDEQTLRAASLATDGPALLDFFRKRTRNAADPEELADLIRKLGDKSAEAREKAAAELVSLGPVAVPSLRVAAKDVDEPELSSRARRCLKLIEGDAAPTLPATAARLLARRNPPGAAEALLAYLPYADDENVVEEVKNALVAVAVHDGKPAAILMQALSDKVSLKRAVAAEALSGVRTPEVQAALRKLLGDPRPVVQLRAALALANTARDPKAVSTLIASLADVPLTQARQAEEYLNNLAGDQAPKVSLGADDFSRQKARDAWAAWWLESEKPTLLEEFTKRTLTDALREKSLGLIKQMGDDDFDLREKAMNDLQALGQPVLSLLRQNSNHTDLEIRTRVAKILQALEKDKAVPLSPVMPRLVALRKPSGAAEVLLAYIPFADDASLQEEVLSALTTVALTKDGKPDPALVKGLQDKMPLRRATAAEALWAAGAEPTRAAVRQLLKDPDGFVRMRIAVAMARSREKDAMPVVIASLVDVPAEQASHAEDYLLQIAGERAPRVAMGTDDATRQKAREAWGKWWDDNRATVDLAPSTAVLASRHLGLTMLLFMEIGKVAEVGRDGKTRWELAGFSYPYDAIVLPNDRVLVAENSGGRVIERTTKGDVIWQKAIYNVINCQRLSNGNTFIVTRNQLVEVDKNGKDVFTYNRPQQDINAAQKTRDGQIIMVTTNGTLARMDGNATKELKSFAVGQITVGALELLPNGRVLLAQYNNGRVVEYDSEGRMVWSATVNSPTSAVRLPNGNTLVASQNTMMVQEIDRAGKVVSEQRHPQRVWKVRRR